MKVCVCTDVMFMMYVCTHSRTTATTFYTHPSGSSHLRCMLQHILLTYKDNQVLYQGHKPMCLHNYGIKISHGNPEIKQRCKEK